MFCDSSISRPGLPAALGVWLLTAIIVLSLGPRADGTEGADVHVPEAAVVGGKYSQLLRVIEVPADEATYGKFFDYGYYSGTEWAGYTDLPAGYWVYVAPHWYIWGSSVPADRDRLWENAQQHQQQGRLEEAIAAAELATAETLRFKLDNYVSLATRVDQYQEPAYRYVLIWKAVALARERAAGMPGDDQELQKVVGQLQCVTSRLARAVYSRRQADGDQAWQQQISALAQEKERLQNVLSVRSGTFQHGLGDVTLEELRDALPEDVTVIDFVKYWHAMPSEDRPG